MYGRTQLLSPLAKVVPAAHGRWSGAIPLTEVVWLLRHVFAPQMLGAK